MKKNSAILVFLLATCNLQLKAEIFPQVKNPDTFVEATIGDIDSLDPAYAYDTASFHIIFQVYEPLLIFKGASAKEVVPLLAEKVPSLANGLISKDGLTYTFSIRQGVKFHDGTPLTAEDVKYSLMRFMLQDRSGGPAALILEPIAGVDATRDAKGNPQINFKELDGRIVIKGNNVVIHLPKPFAPFIMIMAQYSYTMSKKWCIAHGDWDGTEATWVKYNNPKKESLYSTENMNGTGPFMLEKWDKKTKHIALLRNENYWRTPAKLKRIVVKKIDEFTTRKLMVDKGDADFVVVSLQLEPQTATIPGVKTVWIDNIESYNWAFNWKINTTANPYVGSGKLDGDGIPANFFTDRDVRLGFTYAYDRKTHIEQIARGKATVAKSIIAPQLLGYNPNQPIPSFDLEQSKAHFQKAFGGKLWEQGFRMVYIYNTGGDAALSLANMFKRNIESINPKFKIDVRPLEWSTLLGDERQNKVPFRYLGWLADYPDPHNFAHPYAHSHGAYGALYGYNNPKVDALVEKGITEVDPKKREKIYFEINKLIADDAAYIFGNQGKRPIVLRDWVQGYVPNPIFPDYFYFYWMYKELPKK